MKIIYNNIIPVKGFSAINICGVVFARNEHKPLSERTKRHEAIHTRQIIELLVMGFYLWYGIEWIVRLTQCWDSKKAYRNISFEREAYANETDKTYLEKRKRYAFIHFIKLNF